LRVDESINEYLTQFISHLKFSLPSSHVATNIAAKWFQLVVHGSNVLLETFCIREDSLADVAFFRSVPARLLGRRQSGHLLHMVFFMTSQLHQTKVKIPSITKWNRNH
jgi:hypothetical protein